MANLGCIVCWEPLHDHIKSFIIIPFHIPFHTQVIQDMRDEIVDGVIKKGYLTKKGHKRRNWRRRWFILQRTIMRYFESREKLILKVRKERGREGERERGGGESGWLIRRPLGVEITNLSAVQLVVDKAHY
jgi:hypothetical protein